MKPGKGLCFMFFMVILGIDPAQNLANENPKSSLCVLIQLTNRNIVIMYFMDSQLA